MDAYLARVGLAGSPSPAELHRAHVTSIPFENLDPQRGVAVSLASEDLQRKLVTQRRGGYCFEQNLLFKHALEALGAEVELMLARVTYGAPAGTRRPRSHLVLRVRAGGETWHADVGFGRGTLLEPLPFGPGSAAVQSGWPFRVVEDGDELVLQSVEEADWVELYRFVPEPVPLIDLETSNWFTSTHPRSPFVTGLIVSIQDGHGKRSALSNWDAQLALTEQTPAATSVTAVAPESVPEVLASRFGLPGFVLGADGRVVPATG